MLSARLSSTSLLSRFLPKLDFNALDISSKNYLSWVLDGETHLTANGLDEAIKGKKNSAST